MRALYLAEVDVLHEIREGPPIADLTKNDTAVSLIVCIISGLIVPRYAPVGLAAVPSQLAAKLGERCLGGVPQWHRSYFAPSLIAL